MHTYLDKSVHMLLFKLEACDTVQLVLAVAWLHEPSMHVHQCLVSGIRQEYIGTRGRGRGHCPPPQTNTSEGGNYRRSGNFRVKKLSYNKFSCKKFFAGTTPYRININSAC